MENLVIVPIFILFVLYCNPRKHLLGINPKFGACITSKQRRKTLSRFSIFSAIVNFARRGFLELVGKFAKSSLHLLLLFSPGMVQAVQALTFDEAVSRTFLRSPTLRISQAEVAEKGGDRIQAGLYPNPVVAYSVENVLGNKEWKGWESAESRYELAQLIELGGKRTYRISTMNYQLHAAECGFEASKLDVLNRLLKTYVEVIAAQEQIGVLQEQEKIAREILASVSAKVEAGKVSLIQQHKADIAWKHAEINFQKAVVFLQGAKQRLSLFWGANCPNFDWALFPFFDIDEPRGLDACLADLQDNPELIQSQYAHLAARQAWKLEKSQAVPDLTLLVGYKSIRDTRNKGMILGAALPIPIFDRNQGNISKARAEIHKTQEQLVQVQLLLETKLSISHQEMMRAYHEAVQLQSGVLKSATETLEMAQEGYKEGKFEYLEMLDAQRTLYEVRENYIESLLNYHQRRADIEYLTSRTNYE